MPGEFSKMALTIIMGSVALAIILLNSAGTLAKSYHAYESSMEMPKAEMFLKNMLRTCFNNTLYVDIHLVKEYQKHPEKLMKCAEADFPYSLEISTLPMEYEEKPTPKHFTIITNIDEVKSAHYLGTMRDGLKMFRDECTTPEDNITMVYIDGRDVGELIRQAEENNSDYVFVVSTFVTKNAPALCQQHLDMMYAGEKIPQRLGTNVLTIVVEMNPICTKMPITSDDSERGAADLIEGGKWGESLIVKSHYGLRGAMCMFAERGPIIKYNPKFWLINTTNYAPSSSVSVPIILWDNSTGFIPGRATLNIIHEDSLDFIKSAEKVCKTGRPAVFDGNIGNITKNKEMLCSKHGCLPFSCKFEQKKTQGKIAIIRNGDVVVAR